MPKGRTKRAAVPAEPTEDEQRADAPAPAAEPSQAAEEDPSADAMVIDLDAEDDAADDAEEEEALRVRLVCDSSRCCTARGSHTNQSWTVTGLHGHCSIV